LNPIRERSLTKAALETIAIIAYKQPITRAEIEQIRGVNCDYAVQLLQNNNLIEVVGRKDAVGKPLLFGTTDTFLKRFELESLDALPNHKELLDRIRVIHNEGDSLYREFSIPDDDEEGQNDENATNDATSNLENTENMREDGIEDAIDEMVEPNANKTQSKKVVKDAVSVDNAEMGVANEVVAQAKETKSKPKTKKSKPSVESVEIDNKPVVESVEIDSEPVVETAKDDNNLSITESFGADLGVEQPKKVKAKKLSETTTEPIVEKSRVTTNSENVAEEKVNIGKSAPAFKNEDNIKTSEPVLKNNDADKVNDTIGEPPVKLSWKDKMRAKMSENAGHYENLQDYVENKNTKQDK
ncbi:MAG: SMC-Scp complex subunit ScpB, partial [Clostridia bacterium]|nr:SMC-Scp complex subunit ScpB [Clostridia bacterium]